MLKAKILIVEDEGISALSIKSLLENWEYIDPLIALSSDEALKSLEEFKPDLILMDINLNEDVDGVDIANQLKNDFDVPIIYITAHSDEKMLERVKLTEPYGYILKPFSDEELKMTIDTALYRHKMERELKKANNLLEIELEKRKHAEDEFRKSEEKYRAIVETTHEGIVIFNDDNNISYANKQMAEILGYKVEEIVGSHVSNFIWDEDRLMVQNELKPRSKGVVCNLELPLRKKDGSSIWTLVSGNTLFNSKDNFIGILCMIKDISKRKGYEDELKRANDNLEEKVRERTKKIQIANETLMQEIKEREKVEKKSNDMLEFLQTLIDTIPSSIFYKDIEGRYLGCNKAYEDFLGLKREYILGKSVYDVFSRDLADKYYEMDSALFQSPEKQVYEWQMISADGSIHNVIFNKAIYFNADNTPAGLVGVMVDVTDLKKAEEEKKMEHQKLIDIIEFLPDATFVIDHDNNVIAWNRAIEKMTGVPKEEMLGKGDYAYSVPFYGLKRPILIDLILSQDNEVESLYDHVEREGDTLYADVFVPDKFENGGKFLWGKASPFYDEKGNFVGAIESIRDITKRKKMEEQLKESEAQRKIAMNMAKLVHWEYDVSSDLFTFDDQFYKLYSTTAKDEGGTQMSSREYARRFIPPEESFMMAEELVKALETDDPNFSRQVEHSIIRADGERRFIIVRYGVIKDDKGRTIKTYGANQDITERKNAEEELNKNLKRLDILNKVILTANRSNNLKSFLNDIRGLVLEFMNFDGGGIFLIDGEDGTAKLKYFTENPGDFAGAIDTLKINEYPFREVYIDGKSIFIDELNPVYHETSKKPKFKSLAVVPLYSEEKIIGSLNIINKKKHFFTEKEKEIINSIGREIGNSISKLITEEKMKKLIKELKCSNDELQQFAYITSHDLQEPLRTIASFTQLLERRYKNKLDDDADEFIEYIVEASIRMKQMILDLLEYSRIARVEKKCKPLKIENIILNVLNGLTLLIEENNANITYGSLPTVVADENQLFRVFQNLIENAIKFKKPEKPPKIRILAYIDEENNEHVFSVSDNGIGIEEQYFGRIFTIFQRLHTREEYPGTGIGLAISKRIIESHGGRMWVESEPEVGSTFYFTIQTKP